MSEVPLYRQQVAMQLTNHTVSWYYSRLVLVNSWYKRGRISQLCLVPVAGGDAGRHLLGVLLPLLQRFHLMFVLAVTIETRKERGLGRPVWGVRGTHP